MKSIKLVSVASFFVIAFVGYNVYKEIMKTNVAKKKKEELKKVANVLSTRLITK
jgi:hypothetical protein